MQELLLTVARGLVDDKDAVRVTVDQPNEEGVVVYHLYVAEDDRETPMPGSLLRPAGQRSGRRASSQCATSA